MDYGARTCLDRGHTKQDIQAVETRKDAEVLELSSSDRRVVLVETKSIPSSFYAENNDRIEITNEWRPTLLHIGALSGIGALFVSLACLFASLAVLQASNGVDVTQWKYQPSTYLAIFTTIGNQAVRYAGIQGVAIAWWSKALRGSTIASLHFDWKGGLSFFRALFAGRRTNLLTLACIFSTLVTIDGPLLQRASTFVSEPITGITVPLNFSITPELPTGFSGNWITVDGNQGDTIFNARIPTSNGTMENREGSFANPRFQRIIQDILNDVQMTSAVSGCPGTCAGKVQAPALVVANCTSQLYPATFGKNGIHADQAITLNQTLFLVDGNLMVDGELEAINLNTGFSTMKDCVGHFNLSSCTLLAGIGEYDVTIKGDVITVDSPALPAIIAVANNTRVNETVGGLGHRSTLAGIAYAIEVLYAGFVERYDGPKGPSATLSDGTLYMKYVEEIAVSCPTFRNPQPDILNYLNMIMFRSGIWSAQQDDATDIAAKLDPGLSANQIGTGVVQGVRNVFQTNFKFFYVALAVDILSIFFVFQSYWGWWNLGRMVSFSPLEVAKAFDAPLLAKSNTSSTGKQVAIRNGDVPIQYGVVPNAPHSGPPGERLIFGHPDCVQRPGKHETLIP